MSNNKIRDVWVIGSAVITMGFLVFLLLDNYNEGEILHVFLTLGSLVGHTVLSAIHLPKIIKGLYD